MKANKSSVRIYMAEQLRALDVRVLAQVALVRLVFDMREHVASHHLYCVRAVATLKHNMDEFH